MDIEFIKPLRYFDEEIQKPAHLLSQLPTLLILSFLNQILLRTLQIVEIPIFESSESRLANTFCRFEDFLFDSQSIYYIYCIATCGRTFPKSAELRRKSPCHKSESKSSIFISVLESQVTRGLKVKNRELSKKCFSETGNQIVSQAASASAFSNTLIWKLNITYHWHLRFGFLRCAEATWEKSWAKEKTQIHNQSQKQIFKDGCRLMSLEKIRFRCLQMNFIRTKQQIYTTSLDSNIEIIFWGLEIQFQRALNIDKQRNFSDGYLITLIQNFKKPRSIYFDNRL